MTMRHIKSHPKPPPLLSTASMLSLAGHDDTVAPLLTPSRSSMKLPKLPSKLAPAVATEVSLSPTTPLLQHVVSDEVDDDEYDTVLITEHPPVVGGDQSGTDNDEPEHERTP